MGTSVSPCFEDYEKEGPDAVLPPGVYTLAERCRLTLSHPR